jgi:hypothetical protein
VHGTRNPEGWFSSNPKQVDKKDLSRWRAIGNSKDLGGREARHGNGSKEAFSSMKSCDSWKRPPGPEGGRVLALQQPGSADQWPRGPSRGGTPKSNELREPWYPARRRGHAPTWDHRTGAVSARGKNGGPAGRGAGRAAGRPAGHLRGRFFRRLSTRWRETGAGPL